MNLPNALPQSAQSNQEPQDQIDGGSPDDKVADTDALTHALRQSFQATVDEGVPDSLMDLIAKLK